ncbi:MAG: TetR/AcrR family transcriptional regulator [Alphaproteobacteria bacterium]|nr:TetR/AcrR family transcriptional regulator [Alphaproteobacteria bacterium]
MIIDAAERLVAQGGTAAANAREIAAAIGYTPGTIYNHFANLDDLIRHVTARTVDGLATALSSVSETDPVRQLHAMADAYIAFTTKNRRLWAAAFEPLAKASATREAWYRATLERPLALLQDALKPLDPGASEEERRVAALSTWGALHGVVTLVEGDGRIGRLDAAPAPEMVHFLIDCVIAGLAARRKSARRNGRS